MLQNESANGAIIRSSPATDQARCVANAEAKAAKLPNMTHMDACLPPLQPYFAYHRYCLHDHQR